MKWLAGLLVLTWGFTLLLASGATAQIVVQGTLKPDEVHDAELRAAEGEVIRPWSVRLGANEVFESNVRGTPAGDPDVGAQLNAAIARSWTFQRGDVKVVGDAGQTYYRRSTSLNQLLYGMGISGSYKLTPRLVWDVSDTLTTSYAQDTTALSDSGLLPAKLVTHLNTASSVLRYDVSPRSHLRWGLAEQHMSFVSSQFGATSTLATNVSITRQLSRSQTLGVTEEYERAAVVGGTPITEGLLGTWQLTIGRDMTVNTAAGMRLYTLPGQRGFRSAPGGSVAFNAHLRHDDMLGLHYERFVEQALGNGTHLSDQVWASYALSLGHRLALNGTGNYGRGMFFLDPSHKRSGQTGAISARYSVAGNLALAITYGLYTRLDTRADTPRPAIAGHTATMSLTYGQTWR